MQFWKGRTIARENSSVFVKTFSGVDGMSCLQRGIGDPGLRNHCMPNRSSHMIIKIHRNEHWRGGVLQQWHFKNRRTTPTNKRAETTTLLLPHIFTTWESFRRATSALFQNLLKIWGSIQAYRTRTFQTNPSVNSEEFWGWRRWFYITLWNHTLWDGGWHQFSVKWPQLTRICSHQ